MNWTRVKQYYGLQRPFDFRVALAFILSIVLLGLASAIGAFYFLSGNLAVGTARFWFFFYLIIMLGIAATVSRMPTIPYVIICWGFIELLLGLSTDVSERMGYGPSLLPPNDVPSRTGLKVINERRFRYHPLLQAIPKANWHSHSGVNVVHNSLGLRGFEPSDVDLKKDMIFVYGGSSTYDIAVEEGKTWVEMLQKDLGNKYALFNFGVPGYSSSEHLIQTAFYESIKGKRPVCAVYYVGWNDIHNAYIENLDAGYADFQLLYQTMSLQVRRPNIWGAKYSPTLLAISIGLAKRFDSLPENPDSYVRMPVEGDDKHFESIFSEHMATIAEINKARGIKTVFIGQILNREGLRDGLTSLGAPEAIYGWAPFLRNKDVWSYQEHINLVLKATAISNGINYIDPGVGNFHNSDFVDDGHFTATASAKFAQLVSTGVAAYCR